MEDLFRVGFMPSTFLDMGRSPNGKECNCTKMLTSCTNLFDDKIIDVYVYASSLR